MPLLRMAWVTVVIDEETCLQSLVLAKSLRAVLTTGDIIVFVSKSVPETLRNVLSDVFDMVMMFECEDEKAPRNSLLTLDMGKIYSWSLTVYEKCIVLNPSFLILKNCDKLFESDGNISAFRSETDSINFNSHLIIMKPSYPVYKQLIISFGKQQLLFADELILNKCIEDVYLEDQMNILDQKNLELVDPSNNFGKVVRHGVELLDFRNIRLSLILNKSTELVSNEACEVWANIFQREIVPYIQNEKITCIDITAFKREISDTLEEAMTKETHGEYKDCIAIVGQSCRLPGANSVDEFWKLLEDGGDGTRTIPTERLLEHQVDDPAYNTIRAGYLKCAIDEFDAKFFGISPREVAFMDPQQRLLVEVAWEALEDAAINPQTLKGSNTGVFSGIWTHEFESQLTQHTTGKDFHHVILGNAHSAVSARISYFLGLNGPNVATESGCSSSMVALHLACDSLRKRETDLALATGANLLLAPFPYRDVVILSKDGHCKTFDEKADGFARAEGVVVMVLKRLVDAVRDGDRVISLIRGSAMSSEGLTSSFGTPSKYCQEIAIRDALKVARVKPQDVDYVEAHGTGTPVGDPIEFSAISAAYKAPRKNPLMIGSVKTNTGHTESAAGLAGLLKVNLAMDKQQIPPHCNLETLNPNIDLTLLPAVIPLQNTQWARNPHRKRLAGVSSFGISGTNVHIIVEEPPKIKKVELKSTQKDRTHHLLALSAKTENALKDLVDGYATHLAEHSDLQLKDICYTANVGRQHLKYRFAVVAKDVQEMAQKLTNPIFASETVSDERCKIVFLFPGQGSQYNAMAKTLYETHSIFQNALNACDEILKNNIGISINDALFNLVKCQSIDLDETIYSQTSIFCVEYGLLKLWESFGIKPDYVLGHSTGEFAASVAAGVMSLEEALSLVAERSRLIQKLSSGGMLAVRTNAQNVENLINSFNQTHTDDWLDIAVINSNDEVVVAGKQSSLKRFSNYCSEKKVKNQLLAATHAFHSRDMDTMIPEFDKVASKISYKSPRCHYVSGSTGKQLRGDSFNSEYWQKHVRHTVDFTKGVEFVHNEGCNVFIEIGAHPILLALGMSNLPATETQNTLWLPSIRKNEDNWYTILQSLSKLHLNGVNVDWEGVDSCYRKQKVRLPHYPFQRQKYWFDKRSEPLTKALHPLLGRKVPLAIFKDQVYQNIIGLRDFSYLTDHQVANIVILPGAGFLEIILAAGKDALNLTSNKGSIEVKNFVIEAPMEIEEDREQKIQVIASSTEESEGFFVQILMFNKYREYKDEKCWQLVASAEVFPKDDEKVGNGLEEIKSRCLETISVDQFYKTALEVGIKFGETFQSISNIWKGNEEFVAQIDFPLSAGNITEYLRHPIVLDAMLQLAGLLSGGWNSNLHLPVGISNTITTLCESSSKNFYAHATKDKDDLLCVNLYNAKSQLVCRMMGVRLVKTSIGSFMNVINAHKNKLPGMYADVWRPRYSHLHSRVDLFSLPNLEAVMKQVDINMKDVMHTYDAAIQTNILYDKICAIGLTIALLEVGWSPQLGDLVNVGSFISDYLLAMEHAQFIERIFHILEEESILKRFECSSNDESAWVVNQHILNMEELKAQRDNLIEKINKECDDLLELPIILHCGFNMKDMLQGKFSGMEVLFGNEDSKVNPLEIYKGRAMNTANYRAKHFMVNKFQQMATSSSIVRIIEIGAGSGATSKEILQGLQNNGIPFHYTFTDISPHFLDEAEKKFKNISSVEYKILNIEKDPKYQGFVPHSYDVVVAANVIHATEYLNDSIQNVRQLLAPQGILVLQEMLKPLRFIDVVYGTIDGFWRFKDYDIRKDHPCVNENTWDKVCTKNGFKYAKCISEEKESVSIVIAEATDSNPVYISNEKRVKPSIWLIFSGEDYTLTYNLKQKIENSGEQCFIVTDISSQLKQFSNLANKSISYSNESDIYEFLTVMDKSYHIQGHIMLMCLDSTDDQSRFCRSVLYITKYLTNCTSSPKVVVATSGVFYIGDQANVNPSQATVWGIIKSCRSERPDLTLVSVDLDPDSKDPFSHVEQLFSEVWFNNECLIAYRNNKRHVLRANKQFVNPVAPLVLPNGRYEIALPATKNILDVSFKSMPNKILQSFEVEVAVKACALNFRDIFTIMKPDGYYTNFEAVGTDFSGIVSEIGNGVTKYKIGDEVFGISFNSCVASHVVVNSACMLHKPIEFTFAEASTLPTVFLTAYHCMVNVGHLQTGETVLIHVASGGVGLVAIQIAQLIGANIIATAGNKRKRAYLRSLGVQHVFHSRDLSFGVNIDKVTQGRGVDMVLNSLTGQGFIETSLKACARNARFLEIGKVNIWQPQEVEKMRPDVKYTIVNLEIVLDQEMNTLMTEMSGIMSKNQMKPVPHTRFSVSQIKEALNYFMKAVHIGKVVVTMPEIDISIGRKFLNDLIFNSNATYLVTGGLGGIGLEVAKWMVKCGAKHVVLVGRSVPNEDTKRVIKSISSKGVQVISRQVDVGNMRQCEDLFTLINSEMPPLRGVIHSAGTLADGMLRNQTWKQFETVFNAKVKGGWNLHQLTQKMSLEHFVVFSSIAASVGPLGQSNHAAANMYLDSLVFYRHSMGLPAQSINWGAWSEVGAATNSTFGKEGALGLKPFTPSQGIAALQFAIAQPITQIEIAELNVPEFAATAEWATIYFSEILENECTTESKTSIQGDQFWIDLDNLSEEERILYIKKIIAAIIRKTLKLPDSEVLDEHQTFSDMGLDSLMAVEMRNKLQQLFGKHLILNPTSLFDHPTLSSLGKHLAFLTISVDWKNSQSVTTQSSRKEIIELVSSDSILPEHIKPCSIPVCQSKIKSVLITGVTGHFGPYLLNELVQNSELQIFCVVRAKTLQAAEKRIVNNLKKFMLSECTPLTNVKIVLGDITEENLGLSLKEYENLAKQIDSVFHCAVKANHIEEYRKSKSNKDIRSVNVLGTIKMLEFAAAYKTKRVVFVSSYSAANVLNEDGLVSDDFPSDDNMGEGLELGYALTKFVGEKLMGQALKRGIPCTVFRFPTLAGHSVTGHFTTDANFVMNYFLTAARLKLFVDIPGGWNIIPIDIAAKISTRLFFNDQAELGLYNIVPSEPLTSQGYIGVATELGMTVCLVNQEGFVEKLNSDPLLDVFREAAKGKSLVDTLRGSSPVFKAALESDKNIFSLSDKLRSAVHGVEKFIPSPKESIRRQFRYAISNGIFDAIGVEYDQMC